MDFYTKEGAANLAKKRGKATCFWTPIQGNAYSVNKPHRWIYNPQGTIKGSTKQDRYSVKIAFNSKGKQVI